VVTAPQHLLKTGPTAAALAPHWRENSQGSAGMSPPLIQGRPNQLPTTPDYYGRVSSGEPRRGFSNESLGRWGAVPYPYPSQTPPPPPERPPLYRRSGSWTHPQPPQSSLHGAHHRRSGSWNSGGQMHSFSFNPLLGANITRPVDVGAFEHSRSGSSYWGEQMISSRAQVRPPPPPPQGTYVGYNINGGSIEQLQGLYRKSLSPLHSTPSPPYNVMDIARTWSGGEDVQRTWSGDHAPPLATGNRQFDGHPHPVLDVDTFLPRNKTGTSNQIPRLTLVKRDTSYQNENYETKPSQVKRAALNRDQSATSNRLKKECMQDYFNKELLNKEMQTLHEDTEKIRFSPGPESYLQLLEKQKPQSLSQEGRVSTIDAIMNELIAKPTSMLGRDRVSTIDALIDAL